MRILCLHGYGTSASILEKQLAAYIAQADKTWEFIFIDGEVECSKAPGVGAFVPGPFFCYYSSFAPSDVQQAHELLDDVIREQGPFDGVLGFSQGASLALAYLIQHNIRRPDEAPPFKFAVILSTVVSFSPDASFCREVLDNFTSEELTALACFPKTDFSSLSPQGRALFETLANTMQSGLSGGFLPAPPDDGAFTRGDLTSIPRIIHPSVLAQRVKIPTVHIVGKKDSPLMIEQSTLMQGLCDSSLVQALEHSGGHDVPRKPDEAKAAVAATEWAHGQSNRQFW